MTRTSLLFLLVLLTGCTTLDYSKYASRTHVSRSDITSIAKAATERHKLTVVNMRLSEDGKIEVDLAATRDAFSGITVVYKKGEAAWEEIVLPPGTVRVWAY